MSHPALDKFGRILMTEVRDLSTLHWQMVLDGTMKSDDAQAFHRQLASLDSEARSVCASMVSAVVDTVLHNLLCCLDDEDDLQLSVNVDGLKVPNIRDISDGLAGELYTEDGWIARFSGQEDE